LIDPDGKNWIFAVPPAIATLWYIKNRLEAANVKINERVEQIDFNDIDNNPEYLVHSINKYKQTASDVYEYDSNLIQYSNVTSIAGPSHSGVGIGQMIGEEIGKSKCKTK
jgi:hypothetical protein